MKKYSTILLFLILAFGANGQSSEYLQKKNEKLSKKSPFEKIVDGELPADIVYQDSEIIAFVPLRKQAPVHFLIVPKKRINTINDISPENTETLGRMMLVAKKLAEEYGIVETGYRLSVNTNEDAGQSVFHIHLHILGGMKLGPMVRQTYKDERIKE